MNKNIFAYTAPGSNYPGYVSINRTPDGDVTITVRAAPDTSSADHPLPGVVAEYTIPGNVWPYQE